MPPQHSAPATVVSTSDTLLPSTIARMTTTYTPTRLLLVAAAAAAAATHLLVGADVTLTVRSDGSGQFTSVQRALDSLAPGLNASLGHVTLQLLGRFHERVHVYANFTGGVTLVGQGATPLDALIIYNVSGAAVGTFSSWTMIVEAADLTLVNVGVANSANNYDRHVAGQSVALHLNGGTPAAPQRVRVFNSSLLGAQDTLYTGAQYSLSYFYNTVGRVVVGLMTGPTGAAAQCGKLLLLVASGRMVVKIVSKC